METNEKDPMLKQVRAKVNDKEHEVLYKSPGSNPGGPGSNGRTWDFVQATTKEQAAQLIADGWSVSIEEAFELADALKAGKKGKKRLAVVEDEDEDEDDLGLDEAPAPAPAKKSRNKARK